MLVKKNTFQEEYNAAVNEFKGKKSGKGSIIVKIVIAILILEVIGYLFSSILR